MKPIVLMHIPTNLDVGEGRPVSPVSLMNIFNGWDEHRKPHADFLDYLWLVFDKPYLEAPEIQVFHPKDFTDIQYNELKNLVEEKLKELQSKDR